MYAAGKSADMFSVVRESYAVVIVYGDPVKERREAIVPDAA